MLSQTRSNIGKLLVIASLMTFILITLFLLKRDDSQLHKKIDGVYLCREVSDTETHEVLATIPMRITLKGSMITVDNSQSGEIIIQGPYERKLPGKYDHVKNCEYLIIRGAPQVFSPKIYYKDQRLFYLKVNSDVSQLFIFERTKS